MSLDFDRLAADYDRLRPAGDAWEQLAERTIAGMAGCRRLLDVGCGTGRFAVYAQHRLGARVWGVDPSAEMLQRARARPDARGIGWKQGVAERLPFRDGWFDAAHMHLVVHTLTDRRRRPGRDRAGARPRRAARDRDVRRRALRPVLPEPVFPVARGHRPGALPRAGGTRRPIWPRPGSPARTSSASASRCGPTPTTCSSACAAATSRPCTCSTRTSTRPAWSSSRPRSRAGREAFAYSLEWALLTARRG